MKLLLLLDGDAQIPERSPLELPSLVYPGLSPHLPLIEDCRLGLGQSGGDRHSVQSRVEVLFLDIGEPLGEGPGSLEVSCLATEAIQDFEPTDPSAHVILPHIESKLELASPVVGQCALDCIELAVLLLFETLIEHPLFELSVEDEALCVTLGEKLRYLIVLLYEHHGVACEFEPFDEGALRLP